MESVKFDSRDFFYMMVGLFLGVFFTLLMPLSASASTYWEDDDGLIYVDSSDCPPGRNYVLLFDVGGNKRLQEWGACVDVAGSYIDDTYVIYDKSHASNGSSSQYKIPANARGRMIVHTAPLNLQGSIKGSVNRVPTTNLMTESWTSSEVLNEISSAGGSVTADISLLYTGTSSTAYKRENELMAFVAVGAGGTTLSSSLFSGTIGLFLTVFSITWPYILTLAVLYVIYRLLRKNGVWDFIRYD